MLYKKATKFLGFLNATFQEKEDIFGNLLRLMTMESWIFSVSFGTTEKKSKKLLNNSFTKPHFQFKFKFLNERNMCFGRASYDGHQ